MVNFSLLFTLRLKYLCNILNNMDWKHDWSKAGYNLEELYFEKLNRELINQIKAKQASGGGTTEKTETVAEVIPFRPRERKQEKKAA